MCEFKTSRSPKLHLQLEFLKRRNSAFLQQKLRDSSTCSKCSLPRLNLSSKYRINLLTSEFTKLCLNLNSKNLQKKQSKRTKWLRMSTLHPSLIRKSTSKSKAQLQPLATTPDIKSAESLLTLTSQSSRNVLTISIPRRSPLQNLIFWKNLRRDAN